MVSIEAHIIFEFADGSGSWLIYSADASETELERMRREFHAERCRRSRLKVSGAGVVRPRRSGDQVRNELSCNQTAA
jgi:hypothetical protein